MRLSVVIATYNRRESLRQTLAAVTRQDYPNYQVIVVDDGSSDDTLHMVSLEFPGVRCLSQPNRGPAAARNMGIWDADGPAIVFTDDDCLPPPDWLSRLAAGYERYPHVAGVGGSIRAPDSLLATNRYAQYERYVSRVVYHGTEVESVGGFECAAGGTNNMSYRKAALEAVGGFDESFPVAAGEDADLKLRIVQRDEQLAYVPVWVIHNQEYSARRFRRQCIVRGIGRNYFEAKHGPGWPSRATVALRAIKRLLTFWPDIVVMGSASLAHVKLLDGLYTCRGQWARRPLA